MTIKHKHHIEMMNMKRAKKKADFKNAKLQTLLTEIRVILLSSIINIFYLLIGDTRTFICACLFVCMCLCLSV